VNIKQLKNKQTTNLQQLAVKRQYKFESQRLKKFGFSNGDGKRNVDEAAQDNQQFCENW